MPVTARLSRKFYDRFGDDIANEFVNWFNAVDATYRADLIRVNETNFALFDAKLEQRFAESDAKVERRLAETDANVERRLAGLELRLEKRLGEFKSGLMTWIVGLWLTSMLAGGGMFLTLLRTR